MGGMQTSATDYAKWAAYLLSAWPPRDDPDLVPAVDVNSVQSTEVDRQDRAVEACRNELPVVGRLARLATDPAGIDRHRRPDNEHGGGICKLGGDLPVERKRPVWARSPGG
jgi:hypothetical protein